MQVDVFHRDNLRPAAARGSALNAEHRSERRFTYRYKGLFADIAKAVRDSYCGSGFSLSRGSGSDCGYQNKFAVFLVLLFLKIIKIYLSLVLPVVFDKLIGNSGFYCHFLDMERVFRIYRLGNFNIRTYKLINV